MYCISYENAGSGESYQIKHESAHDALIDLIDIWENPSNYNIRVWIKNH